jgi:hypothetical protein
VAQRMREGRIRGAEIPLLSHQLYRGALRRHTPQVTEMIEPTSLQPLEGLADQLSAWGGSGLNASASSMTDCASKPVRSGPDNA